MAKPVGRILVTNDDGIDAPGLVSAVEIAKALSDDVWVFAPAEEMSGASHSLSLSKPMRVIEIEPKRYAVTGTPTDCVMVATRHVLRDNPPDLVLSGVNFGQNIAEDVSYSGTVAGAKEGTVFGIKSIAMSQAVLFTGKPGEWTPRFEIAEKHAPSLLKNCLISTGRKKPSSMSISRILMWTTIRKFAWSSKASATAVFSVWKSAPTRAGATISGIVLTGSSMKTAIWFTRPARARILKR